MAAFTAADVKALREKTGAGMMDAKKALEAADGDIEAAVDALRAKGLATAQKKSSRTAAEGLVGVAVEGTKGVAVEVNSETDFVAKNDQFQDFVRKTTQVALKASADDVEALKRIIADVLKEQTTDHWLSILEPADVWCARVLDWPELMDHAGFKVLDMLQQSTAQKLDAQSTALYGTCAGYIHVIVRS